MTQIKTTQARSAEKDPERRCLCAHIGSGKWQGLRQASSATAERADPCRKIILYKDNLSQERQCFSSCVSLKINFSKVGFEREIKIKNKERAMNHIIPLSSNDFNFLEDDLRVLYFNFFHRFPVGTEVYVVGDDGEIIGPVIVLSDPQLYAGNDFEETGELYWIVPVGKKLGEKPKHYYYITSIFSQ